MLSKAQIIDAIQQVNRQVGAEWLFHFEQDALRQYLDHLQITMEPRGAASRWTRPGDTTAIVTRQPVE